MRSLGRGGRHGRFLDVASVVRQGAAQPTALLGRRIRGLHSP
jgi:hypothetical protein